MKIMYEIKKIIHRVKKKYKNINKMKKVNTT